MESKQPVQILDINAKLFQYLPRLQGAKLEVWADFDGEGSFYFCKIDHLNGRHHQLKSKSLQAIRDFAAVYLMADQ